jgi:1,4-alpha-glucan branching enzyme
MRKILFILLGLIFIASSTSFAQKAEITPTISPDFFTPDEEITITYDVTGTSLSSLSEAWLWLWLPDLSNVDVPSNINPASSDPSNTDKAKFTKSVEEGRTLFKISLTLTEFTNKSASEIQKVGMLIKGNDWSNGQSEDFVFELQEGYSLKVNSPTSSYSFTEADEMIVFDFVLSQTSDVVLNLDGVEVYSASNTTEVYFEHTSINDGKVHVFDFSATNGTDVVSYKHSYTSTPSVTEEALPSGKLNGVNHDSNTSVTLVLTAPEKDNVFVIGDFTDWSLDEDFLMKKDGDKFWLEITGLTAETEYIYQYLIDGELIIADPYSEKVSSLYDDPEIIQDDRYPGLMPYPSDKTTREASYLRVGFPEYDWQVTDFVKPAKEDLVIYELLVRDFSDERTYRAVIDKLDYLDSLGINAIELMPVTEFEGNLSWGYNPSYMMAQDKYYGTEDDLRELIDEAHQRGIAIIFDMVFNHQFGRSPLVYMYASGEFGPPTSDNPWFNVSAKHDYNVGYDMNHESDYTKAFLKRVVNYWVENYNVDGYRFDLSKGFTQKNTLGDVGAWGQKDDSRIAILKEMADVIWAQNPETYVILEHFADNAEEKILANYGMMLWGNANHDYIGAAKGYTSNLNWTYYKTRDWDEPNLVSYMESHDEERVMWSIKSGSEDESYYLNRLKQNAAFFFLTPGAKMIWQFGEMGYDEELNNDRLGVKPTHWEYMQDEERLEVFAVYQSLINLKTQTALLNDDNFSWGVSTEFKWLNYDNEDVKICAYGNFSKSEKTGDPHFLATGTWYDYFSGEQITVTELSSTVTLAPGSFRVFTSEPIENYISINPTDWITKVDYQISEVLIYPNPVSDHVIINTKDRGMNINLCDLSGKVIISQTSDSNKAQLDIRGVESGIYLLKIETTEGMISRKIIKN